MAGDDHPRFVIDRLARFLGDDCHASALMWRGRLGQAISLLSGLDTCEGSQLFGVHESDSARIPLFDHSCHEQCSLRAGPGGTLLGLVEG